MVPFFLTENSALAVFIPYHIVKAPENQVKDTTADNLCYCHMANPGTPT
jgi:hypothetical protein